MPDAGTLEEFDELLAEPPASAQARAPLAPHPGVIASAPRPLELAVPPHDEHMATWNEFAAGWHAGLYQDPVLCATLAGLVLGPLGVFIVLRRAVFVTAAISQSAAFGVALALLLEIHANVAVPPVAGAIVLALAATTVLAARTERLHLPRETAIGFAYVAASAAALLAGDRITQEAHDIAAILFGTAVLVRSIDLWLVAGVGALVIAIVVWTYRGLVFAGFDPEGARIHGLPVRALELLLWVLVALEVAVTTRALGALPVFAFAVLPAMGALAVAERLRNAFFAAAVLGSASGALGYLFAFFFEFPVGASQAVLATFAFLGAAAASRLQRRSA